MKNSILRTLLFAALLLLLADSPGSLLAADSDIDREAEGKPSRRSGFSQIDLQPEEILDLRLDHRGVLDGLVVGRDGVPMAEEPVAIWRDGRKIAELATSQAGRFSFQGLRGGVYEIGCAGHRGVYRLWTWSTAPPSSRDGLLIVTTKSLVRGQHRWTPWFSKQSVISAALMGGAAAAPVVVLNQRRSAS